ncbi:MAG: ABC transporter permease subunit, partial [Candidatus Aureabacteria bacterium]|nr:ABC transporter permease subunit [Candidatus Auribacterota bacterium]
MTSKIITIAKTTFLNALRKRVFQIIFIFGVIIILSTQFFTFFTFGEEIKILKDVGMAGITFFSLIISIVIGSSQIQSDLEKKTIYTVLSCPVSRRQYLIGKAIGVICYVTFAILLLSLVFYIALSAKTYSIEKKVGEEARFGFATFAYNVEL